MPRQELFYFPKQDVRETVLRMQSNLFQNLSAFGQRDAAGFAGRVHSQQKSAHGPSRYTLSIAYALPLAFKIETRRLNVPGNLCTSDAGIRSVPSLPVP